MISLINGIDRYVLLALIVLEALACYNFFTREVAWYPPGNWDQSSYLVEAYRTKERILTEGFGQLWSAIKTQHSTGLAQPILGALSGLCFAGGRFPQLLLLFVGFSALQVSAFLTGQSVWSSRTYGYMLLGLVLCLTTPWYWAGGLFDFRFDFIAYCLYGIWACAVLRSQLFLRRGWAIACGLIGSLLVLNRFLTLTYLLGVYFGFAFFCAVVLLWRRSDRDLAQRMRRRIYNLGLSVVILGLIVPPFIINNWREIVGYYHIGDTLGVVNQARANQSGINSLAEHLFFYPSSILRDHWGVTFILGSAIVLFGSLITRLTKSTNANHSRPTSHGETRLLQLIFLLGAILGPILLLTLNTDKNSVVGGIIGVPAALLVTTLVGGSPGILQQGAVAIPKTVIACSMAVFLLGIMTVFDYLSRHTPEYGERRDLMRLVQLDEWMVSYASDQGWREPGISVDAISPWFNAYSVADFGYEKSGKLIEFHPLFGSDIMGADRDEALSELSRSDFLVLTMPTSQEKMVDSGETSPNTSKAANYQWLTILRRLSPYFSPVVQPVSAGISLEGSTASMQRWPALRRHLYPFYQHLADYRDDVKAWADKNMTLAQTVPFENFTAAVYVRPTGARSGLSDSGR
jgi:hypothetical protein